MLRFLKALFGMTESIEEVPGTATVPLAELESWLINTRAPLSASLNDQLAAARTNLDQLAINVKEKATALQSAQLMNPDIPERAKDFMHGNREEYTRRVLQYLDTLILPSTTDSLPSFFEQHDKDAQEFTRSILRPFQILHEFFAHESKEITALLAHMEQEIIALRQLHDQHKIAAYEPMLSDIHALVAKQQQRTAFQQQREILDKQRAEDMHAITMLVAEEDRLLRDSARQAALQKLAEAHQRVLSHEQKIRDVFSRFEPALRKFHRMGTRNMKHVERYLNDPVATLIEDLHLDILEIVEDITRLMTFDRLQVGDKKPYVNDSLSWLTKEHLGTWMREYGQLAKIERDAQTAVEACEASKTLVRVQRLRDDTRRNLQLTEQRIAAVAKDLEKTNLAGLTAHIETKIKELTNIGVSVVL